MAICQIHCVGGWRTAGSPTTWMAQLAQPHRALCQATIVACCEGNRANSGEEGRLGGGDPPRTSLYVMHTQEICRDLLGFSMLTPPRWQHFSRNRLWRGRTDTGRCRSRERPFLQPTAMQAGLPWERKQEGCLRKRYPRDETRRGLLGGGIREDPSRLVELEGKRCTVDGRRRAGPVAPLLPSCACGAERHMEMWCNRLEICTKARNRRTGPALVLSSRWDERRRRSAHHAAAYHLSGERARGFPDGCTSCSGSAGGGDGRTVVVMKW